MLIGFIGKMGSGKTTAADFLVDSYQFTKHNFKDGLNAELRELYPDILDHFRRCYGWTEETDILSVKPAPKETRQLQQKHGTEVRRGQDKDYWVKKWIHKYQNMFSDNVVVDDVRFFNEVEAIKNMGGIVVRVERDDIKDTGDHASETELDGYEADFTIKAEKGDHMFLFMSLEKIIEDDTRTREEDSNNSSAYTEYSEGEATEGSK